MTTVDAPSIVRIRVESQAQAFAGASNAAVDLWLFWLMREVLQTVLLFDFEELN